MAVVEEGPMVEYVIMDDIRFKEEPKLHMRINQSAWYPVECAIENYASCNGPLMKNYLKKLET